MSFGYHKALISRDNRWNTLIYSLTINVQLERVSNIVWCQNYVSGLNWCNDCVNLEQNLDCKQLFSQFGLFKKRFEN